MPKENDKACWAECISCGKKTAYLHRRIIRSYMKLEDARKKTGEERMKLDYFYRSLSQSAKSTEANGFAFIAISEKPQVFSNVSPELLRELFKALSDDVTRTITEIA